MILALAPIADPHCGRLSDDLLHFEVGNEQWVTRWGRHDAFGSPAYWVGQAARGAYDASVGQFASGTLESEAAFCLLGGYGVSAESAAVAHRAVMPLVERGSVDAAEYEAVLAAPSAETGRRYRFPRQRAQRIAEAVQLFSTEVPPADPLALRAWLLRIPGIGPKTAAWIVRNRTGSDEVAIIDIWLIRSMTACGVFPGGWDVRRHYERFEAAFLQYARQGQVPASTLDLCIWTQARIAGAALNLTASEHPPEESR